MSVTAETANDFWEQFPCIDPGEGNTWVFVGKISRSLGLDGAMKVTIHSDVPERFAVGSRLAVECDGQYREITISTCRRHEHLDVCTLEVVGVGSREHADRLRGRALYVPLAQRRPAPKDCWYPDEVAGMKVLSTAGDEEGVVRELVIDTPSPYLVIDAVRHGQVMMPFRQEFIAEIDRFRRQVKLAVPIEMHVLEKS